MKKIAFLFAFCAIAVQAAQMAVTDKISNTLTVKNDFWQCSFIEGSMFPSNFIFKDGSSAGRIIFRDTATVGKTIYTLHEERHAIQRIIANTADEFIVEFDGCFWRNQNPLISAIKDLNVTCRYEFKRSSDTVKMTIKYASNNDEAKIVSAFETGWFYKDPFSKISIDNVEKDVKKGLKPINPFFGKKLATFENDDFILNYKGENICVEYNRRGNYPLTVKCLPADRKELTISLQLRKK